MTIVFQKSKQPVRVGDVVHYRRKPHTVSRIGESYITLQSMDERKEFKPVFPTQIGAVIYAAD